ncbi:MULTISPECIES: hypothetical protein [Kitasatospora]|uniref:Uncharacterized protein n=1 Tax=Kitasatospora cystarginea TaxID=58350 RepID=A0ABP5QPA2_9ACTN
MDFELTGPLLPGACGIGADAPSTSGRSAQAGRYGSPRKPPSILFSAYAGGFTAPVAEDRAHSSGPLDPRLGLPSPSGDPMAYDAECAVRTYDRPPAR